MSVSSVVKESPDKLVITLLGLGFIPSFNCFSKISVSNFLLCRVFTFSASLSSKRFIETLMIINFIQVVELDKCFSFSLASLHRFFFLLMTS